MIVREGASALEGLIELTRNNDGWSLDKTLVCVCVLVCWWGVFSDKSLMSAVKIISDPEVVHVCHLGH